MRNLPADQATGNCAFRRGWGRRTDLLYGSDKPVSPTGQRLDETRLLRVILEYLANLADGGIDAVVGVEEDIFAPDLFDNLVPADELPALRDQQEKKPMGMCSSFRGWPDRRNS
jgi:hypothetical protein